MLLVLGILLAPKTQANPALLQDALVFTTTSIPNGQYGQAYTPQSLGVTGGTAPYTFSITAGNLPAGMALSTDGTISGTPTATGSFPFTVTAADATPSPNQVTGTQDYTLIVNQASLTITANSTSKLYGAALPAFSVTYSGFVNGDNAASLTTAPNVTTTATAASPVAVGGYPISASGAVDANYNISYNQGTLTINPAPLTITADDKTMTYGGAVPALTVTYTGLVNGDGPSSMTVQPTLLTLATSLSPVGPYAINFLVPAVDLNYTITSQPGTLTINKAVLTVTADDKTMPLGGPVPPLTFTYSGFVNLDNPLLSISTAPTLTTTATANSPAGPYPITPAGGAAANYSFNYVNGTLTVGKGTVTITANPAGSVYGAALVPNGSLTVTYSGFANGDGPGNLTTQPTVANTAVAGSPAGGYVLTPSGASSPNYDFVYVNGAYTISKAPLTVTADDKTMPLGGPLPALTVSYSGFVNGDAAASLGTQPTATTTATATSPAGGYTITPAGGVSNNYSFTYVNGTLTVGKATLTITAIPAGSVYGAALVPNGSLTVTYSGFVNGDNAASLTTQPTVANTAVAGSPAGAYVLTPSGASSPNYDFVYVNGAYTISKAALTVTADSKTMSLGGPLPALTVSYSGFVNGDAAASLGTQPTATTTATATSPAGGYTITPAGGVSNNYSFTYVNGTLTVGKATLTITANPAGSVYGAALVPNGSLTVTYSGFVNGDNAASLTTQPTVANTAVAGSPAGAYVLTPSGAASSNYDFVYVNGAYTISKAALTVTADNKTMPLGGPLPALTVSYSGFVNGDGAASLGTQPSATTTATAASPSGNYPITPAGGVSNNYTFTYVNGTLTVGKATLTITANPAGSVYGAALVPNGSLTVTYSGFVNGDNAASLTTQPTVANAAIAGSPAGTYTLTPSGASSSNYNIVYVNGVYTISPAALVITATNQSMIYGGAVPALTATYSGFVNGDDATKLTTQPTITTTATSASPAGTYPITASGAASPNYTITYNAGTMTVGKAALTVTADNKTMPLGGPLPALTVSYSGFVNGDGAASLTTQPTATTTATAASPAGNYPITPAGGASNNYTFTYVSGTLSVGKATLTITVNPAGSVYGAALVPDASLTVTYSGFVNGDNAASLTTQPTVANTAVAGSPAGTYTLTPSGASSANYNIVYVNGVYTISKAALVVTAANQSMIYGGAVPALTASYSGFVNGDDATKLTTQPTVTTTATSASPAGTYPITASGAADPNYTITYNAGTMTVGKATLTVTADNKTMPLGGPLPALTVSYSGFVNGDVATSLTTQPSATTTATAASPAGSYSITPAGGVANNYNFTYVNGTLSVGKATLTITANAAGSIYGSALVPSASLTVTYSGFVNGDDASKLTTQPVVTNSAVAGSPVGTYTLTPSGASSPNYNIVYVNGVYTISPATLNVTANNQSMSYGAPVPPLTISYSGFVNGDDATKLTTQPSISTNATSASPVGTYSISVTGAASPNYTIIYFAGTMTVGKATLTVTADNKNMPLGGPLPALTVTYTGFVNGDVPGSLTTQPTVTTTATASSPAGTYPITPAGGAAANYSFNYVNGTLSVGKAILTITANPAGSIYGAALVPGTSLTVTYNGFVNGDDASKLTTPPIVSNAAVAGSPVGTYTLTPSGASSPNYNIVYVNGTYTVSPTSLAINADNKNMTYGAALPALTVTYSGFVNGDGPSSLTTPPKITTTATSASPAGSYPISVSGAVNPNYTIVYNPGTVTIGKATLTVTADNKNMPLGGPMPALTLSYSGFVNGDGPTSLGTQPTATTTATATSSAGTYPITPAGGVSANYSFSYVGGTLTIGKAVLTITANPASSIFGAPLVSGSALTVTYSGFVNGDGPTSLTTQPTVNNAAFAGAPVGTYALTASGASSPNYTVNYVNGTYTITPAALNIVAVSQTMTYGGAVPALAVSYSGFVNGDNPASLTTPPTLTTTATSSSPAGIYPITITGAVDPNYNITYSGGTITIGKASLTVTADNKTMPLGGPLPSLTVSYSGFVNGDGPGNLTSQPVLSVPATASSPAGSYPISVSGAASANYNFTYVTGILAIGKALLTITANPASSVYGAPLASGSSLTVTYSGFVNGDGPGNLTQQPVVSNTAFPGAPAGSYALIPSGAQSDNYAIAYVNGTYTISPAALNITAVSKTMPYGGPVAALTVTYSGFVNGDNASRLTSQPTLTTTASVSSPVGTYPIVVSGAVSSNYAITYTAGTMTVQRATLTITPNPASMTYGGPVPALTASYSGFVGGDNATALTTAPTITTTATSASPAGTYPITASGAASSNYNIVYNPGTLTINPATLHVTANAQTKKFGTPDPALTYTVTGYVNGDLPSVFTGSLSRAAGENVGSYPITIGSLSAGSNYTITYTGNNLVITIGSQQITWTQSLTVGCNAQTQVQLTATASSGLPVTYTVSDPTIATVSGNVLSLLKPGTTIVTATQAGDANYTPAQAVSNTVSYQAASLIRQRWNDAIFFDNSSNDYVEWQWYKNGDSIPGATLPYYSETPSLNGQYYVVATNKDSQRVQSCVLSIAPGTAIPGGIKVSPNPVAAGTKATVTANYTSTELQGAIMLVIDLNGRVRQQITAVQPTTQVTMPSETGTYIISLMLINGQKATVNVLVIY